MSQSEALQAMYAELVAMDPGKITNDEAYGDHAMELLLSLATETRVTLRRVSQTPTREE